MINKVRIEIAAVSENEAFARSAVSAFVAGLDPTVEELTEIKTAVSEAVSNSIIHGYSGGREDKIVALECSYDEKGIVRITITDTGKGIEDIEQARKPLFTTGNEDERSGMGFTVMESFMDKVFVESEKGEGTRVILVKTLDLNYGM
ncbi:MAG: anti-sigma F factor [Clostridiales bacterium]|nr:anti-sigma F factor [Clostridiales bacterium]